MNELTERLFGENGGKVLTVQIGGKEFGIPIIESREVIGVTHIEEIPQTPDFMLGMINLRGSFIPVIDLRIKLGFPQQSAVSTESCIVIVDIQKKLTGTLVDSLVGVTTLDPSHYQEDPNLGNNIHADLVQGIAMLDERMIIVTNISKILSNEELTDIIESTAPKVQEVA